jgi:S1-C subfamily serine protease
LTASLDVGSRVPLKFYREGKPQSVTVTIDEVPAAPEVLASLGFRVRPRPAAPDGSGSVIEIDEVVKGSPAFLAGLRPGMRIIAVGQEAVATVAQFEAAVRKVNTRQGLPLEVQLSDGRIGTVFVAGGRETQQP